jgi:SAM-dependent methyltransferase
MTPLRIQCNFIMQDYARKIKLKGGKVLDVGVAGDEKPSGNFKFFGDGNEWKTLDCEKSFEPDYVMDITKCDLPDNEFDLVILSNTIEHVFEFNKAIDEVLRISKKYFIIDCPFMYPYHPDETFGDYWRISTAALIKLIGNRAKIIGVNQTPVFSSILCEKL